MLRIKKVSPAATGFDGFYMALWKKSHRDQQASFRLIILEGIWMRTTCLLLPDSDSETGAHRDIAANDPDSIQTKRL